MKALLGFILVLLTLGVWAQTTPPPADSPSILPSWANGLFNSDASSLTLAVTPAYAPSLKVDGKSKSFGGGAALLYPVTDNAFLGARFDYLGGSLFTPSATVGLQYSKSVFGHNVTAFTVGGAIIPVSGAGKLNGQAGAIVGGGVHANVWNFAGGKGALNLFFEVEKWTIFDGLIYRPGAALTVHF